MTAAIGGAAAVWMAGRADLQAPATTVAPSTGTAPVVRGTVSERSQLDGTLGYDGSYQAVHQGAPGILTAVPTLGAALRRGEILYTVDSQPVRLLYGSTPAYRDFRSGMVDGPDVKQLEQNLVSLGMDPRRRIVVDNHFGSTTSAAIRRWQAAWGLPVGRRTGTLPRGRVAFLPGPVRINEVRAAVGTAVNANAPVLTATSTRQVVTARLPADRQNLVRVGDWVEVSLPGIVPLRGTVAGIGRVATAPSTEAGTEAASAPATVAVTISVDLPAGSPNLDQAPAQLSVVARTHENVLLVPVTALLARDGGGYEVRLSSGRRVEVRPGLYDDGAGSVEVAGDLTAGDRVEVPVE